MKKIIQQLAKTGDELYAKICEVISVDKEEKTADLKPLDGTSTIDDAFLAVDDSNGGIFIEPEVGSLVAVVFVSKEIAVVVGLSELVQFKTEIGGTTFQIDKDGFLLKRENETLKKLMNDLLEAIKKMKFTTNTGSTINLVNINEFIGIQDRFKHLLK
ncbi:hypothetical protein PL373_16195 [Tenacibaculum maritimum]|nr:hypothetical protein [Tenacibaculum maritimum]MDB0602643.1 hypothetical protein [Tenacibaculum maritimum]MDB0611246.1 hypothetical protein [Tenacibaculum maritimum]